MAKIDSILIVDDSEPDQLLARLSIEEYDSDIQIFQAYDGQEALEVLASTDVNPDLIFLDINMPRMNGHEFLAAYEATGATVTSVVVMLTSSAQDRDREQTEKYDFVKNYVVKPLEHSKVGELA